MECVYEIHVSRRLTFKELYKMGLSQETKTVGNNSLFKSQWDPELGTETHLLKEILRANELEMSLEV